MIVGIAKETLPGEKRVALVPTAVGPLTKKGLEVCIETGAGEAAGFADSSYREAGAKTEDSRDELFRSADVILHVRTLGANPDQGRADLARMREGQVIIGMAEPYTARAEVRALRDAKVSLLAMELVPRITRAQSMDVLSSMASITGYKAVLIAADALPKMFPMMMTAAGTITPAKVLVIGAGVAGLQAIATARRLGAVVHGYDIRPEVREQIESLGGKFVAIDMDTTETGGEGGYAKEMTKDQLARQQKLLAQTVGDSDVVITTAAVPGRKAPRIVTTEMIAGMSPGSVVVDLAAERGGNCEPTRANETINVGGVSIIGPVNLESTIPYHASQMYARNVSTLLQHLLDDGKLKLDADEDEITREMLVCHAGEVVHAKLRELMNVEPAPEADSAKEK